MDRDKIKELEAQSVEEGQCLFEMTQTSGWKIFMKMVENVKDVNRLKISPESVSDINLHTITYIAGQVEGVEKLFKMVNSTIRQKDKILKEQHQPNMPPL